ncbi:hypothetical protein DSM106972_075060 [Dulcicalothrix desertica PCC 7102]|uniref:Uncharacterized protein n=1 Tax=Dulcicalothrix desertica PCC 7102 TaxID=232991 RepID=A0A433V2S9_9CYAN|nr:hypothetical protein DSM106972_075060 [Dulcicalothrix desertica PCC 7102]TWH42485.1 hypothetical protein CAL7102_06146 [Dulcicalothrix desertica PCC 7102]
MASTNMVQSKCKNKENLKFFDKSKKEIYGMAQNRVVGLVLYVSKIVRKY